MKKTSSKRLMAALLTTIASPVVLACGSEPFLGEICSFPYNFCPRGFSEAAGQLLPISQNTALFALLGTTYGGDGRTNFALPDLRGRAAIGDGAGAGLTNIALGEEGGTESVTLNSSQMPSHSHAANTSVTATSTVNAVNATGNSTSAAGKAWATSSARDSIYSNSSPNTAMAAGAVTTAATAQTTVGIAGGSQPVSIRSPYLGLKYCIAVQGIFPPRN